MPTSSLKAGDDADRNRERRRQQRVEILQPRLTGTKAVRARRLPSSRQHPDQGQEYAADAT